MDLRGGGRDQKYKKQRLADKVPGSLTERKETEI